MSSFSNYFLQSISPFDIINFCEKIYRQINQIEKTTKKRFIEPVNISISNIYSMFDENYIIPYVKRFNINYISSFLIPSIENNSFIVLSPKEDGKEFLKILEIEKSFRTTLILDRLFEQKLYIDIETLYNKCQPQYIEKYHICKAIQKEIINNENYNISVKDYRTISSIYTNILQPIYEDIPLNLYKTDFILSTLKEENIILVNPEQKNLNLFNKFNNLIGVIQSFKTPINIIEYCKNKNIMIYPGTGEII